MIVIKIYDCLDKQKLQEWKLNKNEGKYIKKDLNTCCRYKNVQHRQVMTIRPNISENPVRNSRY